MASEADNGTASDAGPERIEGSETPPSGRYGTFSSLRLRNYRYLWLGQISHAGALWMEQIARPFLILEITDGSASHVGAVIAVRTIPQLLFGVWAGVVADWFDRRLILLIDKSAVLTINILFALLIVIGSLELWHIYAYAFLRGTMMAFDQPARQALIPSVVPAGRVTNAVALMSATQNTMRIVGATLGGLTYAVMGPAGAFVSVAVIYVGAVVTTYLLDVPTHVRPDASGIGAMGRGLIVGARFAWSHTAIRGVLVLSLVYFTFGMSYMQVFLPLFADRVMDIGSAGFGLMSALTGAGALVAALFIANRQPARLGTILPVIVVAFGAMLIVFSLATYLPRPAGLLVPFSLITVVGATQTSYFSLSRAMMLNAAPEDLRGRVISLLSLDRALMTAGAAVAGFLSDALGVQVAQVMYGVVCVAGGIAMFAFAREFRRAHTSYQLDAAEIERPAREAGISPAADHAVPQPRPTVRAR